MLFHWLAIVKLNPGSVESCFDLFLVTVGQLGIIQSLSLSYVCVLSAYFQDYYRQTITKARLLIENSIAAAAQLHPYHYYWKRSYQYQQTRRLARMIKIHFICTLYLGPYGRKFLFWVNKSERHLLPFVQSVPYLIIKTCQ